MKGFSQNQEAQLRDIADHLRRVRSEQGISLEEIAVKTFIPLRLLQALDDVQLERLPEPVFVQGFIRRYADAIGADGLAVARSFSLEPQPVESQSVEQIPESATTATATLDPPETTSQVAPRFRSGNSAKFPRFSIYWMGAIALVFLGAAAFALWNRSQTTSNTSLAQNGTVSAGTTQPTNTTLEPPPSQLPGANSTPIPSPSINPMPSETASPTSSVTPPVQIAVSVTGDKSWILVKADDKSKFEGMLKKGDQKTWTAQKKIYLRAGDAGAVSVSYNQNQGSRLGAPGEIQEIVYTPTGKSAP